MTLLTTPLYEASTRILVSTTTPSKSPYEAYQGTLFTQQRVISYTKLLSGEALAQRTVDRLHLNMSAATLQAKVKATAADTALIDVSVRDPSPVQARNIADALSDELVVMVGQLESPWAPDKRDARVVVQQSASIPTTPVIPKTTRNFQIALVLGPLLGIGLAVLRDRLDNSVRDQHSMDEITGAGLIANTPRDRNLRKVPAIAFAEDRSAAAEAFRKLRNFVLFREADDPPRVIVVTSSLPGEGKSITAVNLALALAEADQNVVLVDGDMRRPAVSDYLGLIGSVGISTVLAGGASLHEVLQTTRYRGLTVLASGPIPPNPSELLCSMAAKKVFSEMRSGFDYVIVDSSALLPVADGAALAAQADGALLITRFAGTKRARLAQAVGNLRNVEARILGAVFTMVPQRESSPYSRSYAGDVGDSTTPSSPRKKGGRRRARHQQVWRPR